MASTTATLIAFDLYQVISFSLVAALFVAMSMRFLFWLIRGVVGRP